MYPPAYHHGDLTQIYPNVYVLYGSIKMGPGMRMNRNMVVCVDQDGLTLINPVRMNEAGLQQLDALGKVVRVMRLGDFHGLDDEFYLNRYACEFWAQAGQSTYPDPKPNVVIKSKKPSPIARSEFFIFKASQYPEAVLYMSEYKLLITTDSVQYYEDWSGFTGFTKFIFKLMGFKLGLNIGGPWVKRVSKFKGSLKPNFDELLKIDFDALIAAHGKLLERGAKQLLKREVERVFGNTRVGIKEKV